jgi:hypothetical protein
MHRQQQVVGRKLPRFRQRGPRASFLIAPQERLERNVVDDFTDTG